MMRFNSFGRTLLFGAMAAIGWLPWMMLAGPLLGTATARVVYLIAVTATYVAGLSTTAPYRLTLAAAAALGAGIFAMFADTTTSVVLLLVVIVGVARSGFIYAAPAPQAVIREVMLLSGGMWLARFVAGAATVPTSGALWAFFLVQALFFLTPGYRTSAATAHFDAFDDAYRRASSLLDEPGV